MTDISSASLVLFGKDDLLVLQQRNKLTKNLQRLFTSGQQSYRPFHRR